eukprot:scaffold7392_cov157-Isochrysis_galbana.AAC.4
MPGAAPCSLLTTQSGQAAASDTSHLHYPHVRSRHIHDSALRASRRSASANYNPRPHRLDYPRSITCRAERLSVQVAHMPVAHSNAPVASNCSPQSRASALLCFCQSRASAHLLFPVKALGSFAFPSQGPRLICISQSRASVHWLVQSTPPHKGEMVQAAGEPSFSSWRFAFFFDASRLALFCFPWAWRGCGAPHRENKTRAMATLARLSPHPAEACCGAPLPSPTCLRLLNKECGLGVQTRGLERQLAVAGRGDEARVVAHQVEVCHWAVDGRLAGHPRTHLPQRDRGWGQG